MSAPIKVYIVEMLTAEEVKPILVTAEREEAEALVNAFNDVRIQEAEDAEESESDSKIGPVAILRKGMMFYQPTPRAEREVVA